jgi:putative membrane protein
MMAFGGFIIVLVLFLLLVAAAIAAVVWLIKRGSQGLSQGSTPRPSQSNEALEILRQRYARGDIDREEFERIRDELRS